MNSNIDGKLPSLYSSSNFEKFNFRTYTSNFIIDVGYAFKGATQKSYIYWLGHLSMLLFFAMRLIFVFNTPDIVHVPRITLHENAMLNEAHYQFRNDLEFGHIKKWLARYFEDL